MKTETITRQNDRSLKWKSDVPALFKEILSNPGTGILKMPLQLTLGILAEVAQRCTEINDPILNELMIDLNLYELPQRGTKERDEIVKAVRSAASKERDKNS